MWPCRYRPCVPLFRKREIGAENANEILRTHYDKMCSAQEIKEVKQQLRLTLRKPDQYKVSRILRSKSFLVLHNLHTSRPQASFFTDFWKQRLLTEKSYRIQEDIKAVFRGFVSRNCSYLRGSFLAYFIGEEIPTKTFLLQLKSSAMKDVIIVLNNTSKTAENAVSVRHNGSINKSKNIRVRSVPLRKLSKPTEYSF